MGVSCSSVRACCREPNEPCEVLDVAIIGGGLSGAYISYQLSRSHSSVRIKVFERSHHVGGRLMSVSDPSGVKEELGGMRIFPNVQQKITSLMKKLDQTIYAYPETQPANFFYDAASGLRTPISKLGPDIFTTFVERFQADHPVNTSQALNAISVGDLFDMYGSLEDRQKWNDQLGYDNQWETSANVWDDENKLLQGEHTMYMSEKGWQYLVRSLLKDSNVSLGEALESVHFDEKKQRVCLRFESGRLVLARSVFITIPSLQMKGITGIPQSFVDTVERSLWSQPACKMFLSWASAWWTADFDITGGRSTTTLRSRMIYYWDETTLLVYDCGPDGGASALTELHEQAGMEAVIDAVVSDLSVAHYGEDGRVPQPEAVHFQPWTSAASMWRKGVEISTAKAELMRPLGSKVPVWHASSDLSDSQGWMEGALQSSDIALESYCAQGQLSEIV